MQSSVRHERTFVYRNRPPPAPKAPQNHEATEETIAAIRPLPVPPSGALPALKRSRT